MPNKSFERFYYEKIAISEGCGCAEQFIGTRDLDTRSNSLHHQAKHAWPDDAQGAGFSRSFWSKDRGKYK